MVLPVLVQGTAFEKFIGNGQAKNLFFKVPSGWAQPTVWVDVWYMCHAWYVETQ